MMLKNYALTNASKILDIKAADQVKGGFRKNPPVNLPSGGGTPPPIRGLSAPGI